MTEGDNFCRRCGRSLLPQDRYCPECGMMVADGTSTQNSGLVDDTLNIMGSRLNLAAALLLIYSIPLLVVGLYILLDSATIADTLFSTYQDYAGVSESELDLYVEWVGYTCLASSVMGIASAVLCFKRRAYWVALSLCILSTFTGVMGILALLFGMIAFWMILTGKPVFDREKTSCSEEKSE